MERTKDKYGRGQPDERDTSGDKDEEWINAMMDQLMKREERRVAKDLPYPASIRDKEGKPILTLDAIIKCIKTGQCKKIITMAGQGISRAPALPELYDEEGDPLTKNRFHIGYLRQHPEAFYNVYWEYAPDFRKHKPTSCHYFIRLLQDKGLLLRHYTENVDGTERHVGIRDELLVEAHGSFATNHCTRCEKEYDRDFIEGIISSINGEEINAWCHNLVKGGTGRYIYPKRETPAANAGNSSNSGEADDSASESSSETSASGAGQSSSEAAAAGTSGKPASESARTRSGVAAASTSGSSNPVASTSGTSSVPGTSGTSSVPGTSGTSSVPGTSGTSPVPGTSGASSVPGTSGNDSIPGTSSSGSVPPEPGFGECGGVIKPDITFFGEELPSRFFDVSFKDVVECDLLIIMGTKLTVQPFASLFERVFDHVPRLYINDEMPKCGEDLLSIVMGMDMHGLEFMDKMREDLAHDEEFVNLHKERTIRRRDVFHKVECKEKCCNDSNESGQRKAVCHVACDYMIKKLGWENDLERLKRS